MVKRLLSSFLLVLCVLCLFSGSAIARLPFGVKSFSVVAENKNGTPDVQAGSHPYAFTTSFTLNENPLPEPLENSPKDIHVELPPGFFGDPQATPRCSYVVFLENKCPPETQVGRADTYIITRESEENPHAFAEAIYNIESSPGIAAEFAYHVTQKISPIFFNVSVRTGGDYGVTVKVPNITATAPIEGTTATLWGVPGDPSHDAERGRGCFGASGPCPNSVNAPPLPLLTNPTSCGVPRTATFSMDSWREPGQYVSLSSPMPRS